jgi:hypothetical protein
MTPKTYIKISWDYLFKHLISLLDKEKNVILTAQTVQIYITQAELSTNLIKN